MDGKSRCFEKNKAAKKTRSSGKSGGEAETLYPVSAWSESTLPKIQDGRLIIDAATMAQSLINDARRSSAGWAN